MTVFRLMLAGALALLAGCGASSEPPPAASAPAMRAFADDGALRRFLAARADWRRKHSPAPVAYDTAMPAPPPPATAPAAPAAPADQAERAAPGITNTQEAGVDEGGIVKVHGRHLVILRRGRLFTVEVGDRTLHPVDRIDVFPPGTSGRDAWYDELLVAGDRAVVVGFSQGRGGTEINRFRIGADGSLRFEDSYHLRSNDYYSANNYASRLIGDRLIFYTPLVLGPQLQDGPQSQDGLPALRRWTGKRAAPFERIAPATRVYVPEPVRRDPTARTDVLHTVTTCDLAAERMACRATAVLGSWSRNFYVSGGAVYVWIDGALGTDRRQPRALVYRLPLDGGTPGAVAAVGGPVDQFSFREDPARGTLDVLVRAGSEGDGQGEAMWSSEVSAGDAALLRLPLALFGDGRAAAPRAAYRALPLPDGENWSFHNRFVGSTLVYAAGEFAGERPRRAVFVAPVDGAVVRVPVQHGVDRIDVIGSDAMVVGNDAGGRLGFTAIRLGGGARAEATSFLVAASEGERRSQAFFYRPDPGSPDGVSGTLGLPVMRTLRDSRLARFLGSGSAIAFLRREDRRLVPAGELAARPGDARDDGCQASCVDWYGNARPIFLGTRILALMGYELVEGRLEQGRIVEVGRTDYSRPADR